MPVTLLIVDDNAGIRRYCQEEFEAEGYRIKVARDGHEAMLILVHTLVDLIVMDVHMPRCGGLDAIRKIGLLFPQTPIVLHTSAPGDWDRRTGLPCVAKSEDLAPLKAVVARLLSRSPQTLLDV